MTETPWREIADFREAEALPCMGDRVEAVRTAAVRFRARFEEAGAPLGVRSCDLITLPYPTDLAFRLAIRHPSPYLMFTNRMHVVRFRDAGGIPRTLLWNPTDHERAAEVPFYKRLRERYGEFLSWNVLSQRHGTVPGHLARLGLDPADVDYVAFDHLHTQDLRRWLGPDGLLPNATLLVPAAEWRVYDRLHPLQAWWYIPEARDGVPEARVALLSGDVTLGEGVALLATPGHTWGNQSLVLNTPRGVFVSSENGVCLDNYAPAASRLPGLRDYAATGQEVVLNGNTLEGSLDQYTSMIKEKAVAGPHPDDARFPNFFSSSELTPHWLFPGLAPTLAQRQPHFGQV
jgi:hypothetical protein